MTINIIIMSNTLNTVSVNKSDKRILSFVIMGSSAICGMYGYYATKKETKNSAVIFLGTVSGASLGWFVASSCPDIIPVSGAIYMIGNVIDSFMTN